MANVKFELNREGVAELMLSPQMKKIIDSCAQTALEATPIEKGYSVESGTTNQRCFSRVQADTYEAGFYNKKTNILSKAVGSVKVD